MNMWIRFSILVLLFVAMTGFASGAVVVESEEYECANMIAKLQDLLAEDDRESPTFGLLRQTLTLELAKKCGVYVVRPGDFLRSVAMRFDTTLDELLRLNPELGGRAYRLELYQVIRIREKGASLPERRKSEV